MTKADELYNDQITAVVHGFMEVWNKFEGTLSRELAQIQDSLQGMQNNEGRHPSSNYELFYRACGSLYTRDSVPMGEFSNALSVPLSTATRIADWLVDNGYLQRLPDPDDRRVVRVALSATGRELYEAIDRYIRERVKQVFSNLTAEETAILLTLIAKVVAGLKQAAE
ncbi:MarR family winged helix-turn-helix transcriptional regulator [Chloroflexota bacterium]